MAMNKKIKPGFDTNMTDRQVLRVLHEFHRVSAAMRDVGVDPTLDSILSEATMMAEVRNLLIIAIEYTNKFKNGEAVDNLLHDTKKADDEMLVTLQKKQQARVMSESPFGSFVESIRQQQVCKDCGQHICGGCGKCHECEARKRAPLN